jgi:DNA-directed RNA polymerase subunit M/transcription elongation factor TFIIS
MHFCEKCGAIMTKSPLPTGEIVFQCKCQQIIGGPDDTLMEEGHTNTNEAAMMHMVFIENSPFDTAANCVKKDCPQCGMNYLTLIRVGGNEVTMYTCECGYRAVHSKYVEDISKIANAK